MLIIIIQISLESYCSPNYTTVFVYTSLIIYLIWNDKCKRNVQHNFEKKVNYELLRLPVGYPK